MTSTIPAYSCWRAAVTAPTRLKICGISQRVDAYTAIDAGADALGLVFHPSSPRFIAPEQAAALTAALPPFVALVGLFVNRPVAEMVEVARLCRLDTLQLHGDESPDHCLALRQQTGCRLIKAIRVAGPDDLADVERYPVDALLFDARVSGSFGGTGQCFDWSILTGSTATLHHRWILAGGLTPDNVADAIRQTRPYAVDVSSGVESAPGQKDADRIKRFAAATFSASSSC
ncbi:MAG: phosphoribosylanthranilate isomerase [Magnetococcales bacterium]|nr:phosphoribosylanthranilate isomerase [Magnetococcales bacterium]